MSKKIIITEEEKKNIKSLYNINEQGAGDLLKDLINKFITGLDAPKSDKPTELNDLTDVTEKGQSLLSNTLFKDRLSRISKKIGVDENSIIKLMNLESKLDPSSKNSSGCVGLIQFCPDPNTNSYKTIAGKRYNLEELRNNLDLQMKAIEEFWVEGKNRGKINSAKDLYIYNFFPVAAGKPDNFVLKSNDLSAKSVAHSNPIFNRTLGRPRDTPLTVGDLENYYKKTGMI